MTSSQDSTNLLESIKLLYSRIMALHAESRARSSLNSNNVTVSQDIATPLSQVIEKLATSAASKLPDTTEPPEPELEKEAHERASINRDPASWTELGELSLHLKDSHRYLGPSMDTGDRLVQSTWEHLHASIRLARQGNAEAARLHAELTNNALNEAAYYLPESIYSQFSKEVMEALKDIIDQNSATY